MGKKPSIFSSINQPRFLSLKSVRVVIFIALFIATMTFVFLSAETGTTTLGLFSTQPAIAQPITVGDIWRKVYQQLPDFPKENTYSSKEGGVAQNNTLVSRMIQYHVYIKGRPPIYRLDWKLTLADYLEVNEVILDTSYPGHELLKKNPLDGDRAAIKKLNRTQRDALVQALVNAFTKQ